MTNKLPKWTNTKHILGCMTTQQYHNRIKHMAYHNLYKNITLPDNIGSILDLGMKFCIQRRRPLNSITEGMLSDTRMKYHFCWC